MHRRHFIQITALGLAAGRCTPPPQPAAPSSTPDPARPFELDEATVDTLQEGMRSGRYTARSITELYLKRIEGLDRQGPALRSILETNPDALAAADALDAERKSGKTRGPLHGIPVILKDNVGTADKMHTSAGSLALADSIPSQDAFVAKKLREAGAILIAKANMSEWANFRSTRSTSGWSGRGGLCRNPYALDRNACGSSSGSGVAVAANLAAVSIGTETDGSIVCPSSRNGIVGIKPTLGLLSRAGIIPIAHSQDTAGPMTRSVKDAAILLGAMTGVDPSDGETANGQGRSPGDYAQYCDPAGLKGARIGIARKMADLGPAVSKLLDDAIAAMKGAGAEIVDPVELPGPERIGEGEMEVLLFEFKADLNAYLQSLGPGAPVKSLAALIEFNEQNRDREMPYFGQELFTMAEVKGPLTSKPYLDALAKNRRISRDEGIDRACLKDRLDAIVALTGGPAWVTDLVNGDHYTGGSSQLAAIAGYPSVTVPAGFIRGLPVGISFFGRAWTEPALIRIAYAFEQTTKHRRPPKFAPTVAI